MSTDDEVQVQRIGALERRMEAVERQLVTREALDEEIRSLEQRLSDLRESAEG